jgi:glycosyltransferase involved in cell wall biosynthesis
MWNGVHIVHAYDPESKIGTAGQFIYDLNCIVHARRQRFDVVLQLGYTSSSIWWWAWPRRAVNIVNMDGLEWKRSKYSPKVQAFLKQAERWAALHAHALVSDSEGIKQHLLNEYRKPSTFIPYGAEEFTTPNQNLLEGYGLEPFGYDLLIARMEPENNIEMVIQGFLEANMSTPLFIVGATQNTPFGRYLTKTFGEHKKLVFAGSIYDSEKINNLRYFSRLYFHGHSVGGTNPSLLEAMACNAFIAAHDNVFNRSVLHADAWYFQTASDVSELLVRVSTLHPDDDFRSTCQSENLKKIRSQYTWERIVAGYESLMLDSGS